jgi:hypothetical protein
MTSGIQATLLELEDRQWEANRNADADFYRGYLTDDALVVSRFGVLDRQQILRMFAGGNVNPFLSTAIEDPRVVVLDHDSAILTYKATIEALITKATTADVREGQTTVFSIYASTVYVRANGTWRAAFHQQTPL